MYVLVHDDFYLCYVCSVGCVVVLYVFFVFFFKQKTAYEMRISDWSSDVCSSDLIPRLALQDSHVWVARDGRAAKRQVRTGIGESEHVQVTSGLAEGDSVILSPPSDLEEGERVRPVEGE